MVPKIADIILPEGSSIDESLLLEGSLIVTSRAQKMILVPSFSASILLKHLIL